MKKFYCLLSVFLVLSISQVFATDYDVIYARMYAKALTNPSKTSVDAITALMNADGSFSDLDYTQTATDLTIHLTRLTTLAGAYKYTGNAYNNNATIKSKYYTSLNYWITKNHQPDNWWYRHIAYPKATWPGVVLMSAELQAENVTLFNNAITYLRWAYLQNNYMDGANGADKIAGAFPSSVLIKSDAQLQKYRTQIMALITIQDVGEGIEQDYMFAQHSGTGRQLYANYEIAFMTALLENLAFVQGTVYNVTDTELGLLEEHHLQGVQWYIYNNHVDPSQTGRKPSTTSGYGGTKTNAANLLALNTPRKAQIAAVCDRINNGSKAASLLSGNKMSWRFDYMIHRRPAYYISNRMASTRCVGMESGNGEGITNYYGGSGLNFIFRTGKEYESNYFTVFNYRQWPGITVEQDNATLPLVDWGAGGLNGNAFAGGVSDGNYGSSGFIYSKRNVTAYKGWFYFENEIVALGNGITQTNGTASVFTTVNQALQKGNITYSKNSTQQTITTASGTTAVTNPDWILQDSVAYVNLLTTSNFKISSDTRSATNIFTAGIDHGTNPANASYAYVIYPNTSAASVTTYKANVPLQILSNTKTVQAVYHKTLKITQAIFFTAGSLTLADGKIVTVNAPSAVMIKDTNSTYQISVANPLCETNNPASLTVTISTQLTGTGASWNGTVSSLVFALPQGDFSGQSVTKTFTVGDCAPAFASSDDGNVAENTLDNDLTTRWSANGDGQFITFCLGTSKIVNRVDIAFYSGDTRVFTFDVLVSSNGTTWINAASGLKSSGTSTALQAFTFAAQTGKYVKIVGHGNSSSTWNSYAEVAFPANELPFVTITSPANNAAFTAPASVTITASASDNDGTIAQVQFYNGTTYLGNALTAPYTYTWNNVAQGSYKISAKAFDNAGDAKYSSVNITVGVTTGIDINTISESGVLIYPNPASDVLYLDQKVDRIEMTDVNGHTFSFVNTNEKVNISGLNTGIYMVKVYLKSGESLCKKILKN